MPSQSPCPKCGVMVDQGIALCPRCGTQIDSTRTSTNSYRRSGQATVQYPPARQSEQAKPTGVRALTVLFVLGGINSLYLAALSNPLSPYLAAVPAVYPFNFLIGRSMYFYAALGALSLMTGIGLVRLGKWAWKLGMIVCAIAVLSIVLSNYIGVILAAATIYFMIKGETRSWFRRA